MPHRTGAAKLSASHLVGQAVPGAGAAAVHQGAGGAGSARCRVGLISATTPPLPAAAPLVAVTGATGFIGQYLCRHLLHSGFRVRVLARIPERALALVRAGADLIVGDLGAREPLRQLVTDCAAVIHCAGSVRGRTRADFDPANVQGTRQLVQAVLDAPARPRLLALSSLAAREPGLSAYAASKFAGEQVVTAARGLDWTIFRPPAVYGPGDRELLPLLDLMTRGIALLPGHRSDRVSVLHVADLACAAARWLAVAAPLQRIFTLSDPSDRGYAWSDIIAIAGTIRGRRVRSLHVPAVVLDGIAGVNWAASALLRYAPMLTPGKVRELRHPDWVCDWRELGAAIGWQPEIDLPAGMRATLLAAPRQDQ